MENKDFIELFKSSINKCPKCNSIKLLLFVETRIKDCVAWACFDCHAFEVRVKGNTPEEKKQVLESFFKSKYVRIIER